MHTVVMASILCDVHGKFLRTRLRMGHRPAGARDVRLGARRQLAASN